MTIGSWVSGLFGSGGSPANQDIGFGPGNVGPDTSATGFFPNGVGSGGLGAAANQDIGFGPGVIGPDIALGPSAGSGTDWGKVSGFLGDLSKSLKSNQQQQQQAQAPAVVGQSPSAGVGRPTSQVSLDALVRMLAERRNQYMQSAMSGHAQPVQQSNTRGLLGF
jgi:hypothetical protein